MRRFLFICLGTAAVFLQCRSSTAALADISAEQPASSREMAADLRRIYEASRANPSLFDNRSQLELLNEKLKGRQALVDALPSLLQLAYHEMNAGYSRQAIQSLDRIEALLRQAHGFEGKVATSVRSLRAVAWMRVGEQDNCLTNHTTLSCLAPIAPGGVHHLPEGSRKAIQELTALLTADANDLRARWLLNIAYMTLGEWPSAVPAQWLIPESAFRSDYDIKPFPDIAAKLGLDVTDLAGGVVADDFDNDGNIDLLVSGWGIDSPVRLFQNLGDGGWRERGREAGLAGLTLALNMIQADFDNDGFVDVLLLRGGWLGPSGKYPMSLLHNNGNGTFTDVTKKAGLLRYRPTQTAVWFDYDNDGWIDLFVGNESFGDQVNPCELYHNNQDGTFTDVAAACGLDRTAFVKGVTAGDYNNDGRPDLYLSLRGHENLLFRNDGPKPGAKGSWSFTELAQEAGVAAPQNSFPTWFFDYDNDGLLDLFVAGYNIKSVADVAADYLGLPTEGEKARLYHNLGNGKFEDVTAKAHLDHVLHAMGCNFGDLDNDGFLDFYLATGDPDLATLIPNRMFRNAEGKFFQDVTTSGGFGHLQKGHAVAFADFDNDGDQDVFVVMGGAFQGDGYRRVLFENPGHGNNWIQLKLVGVKSNRSAIGARIHLRISENGKRREIFKTVNSGGSFGSNPLLQHLGLGKANAIELAEIFWPTTGKTQVISRLSVNTAYQITENAHTAAPMPLHPVQWKNLSGNAGHDHHH